MSKIFFGLISTAQFSFTCDRRQRLRSAIATERLAFVLANNQFDPIRGQFLQE